MQVAAQQLAPAQTLESLMQGYQNGDRDAANALIDSVSPALHRFFSIQTGDRRHADDLLQDAWLRVHKARHTYRPGQPVLPWLYAIARHTRVDAFRRRRFERYEEAREVLPEPPPANHETGVDLPDLEAMLGLLPASQREVVVMLKVSGLSLEEVARATASSVGSVKQKAHRAYGKLRDALGEWKDTMRREPVK